ncbi:Hypothetical protein DHA2_151796, partial [Giardia duodenalis]
VAQTTTLRCGQDQSASVSQALQGSHLLPRDSHRSRVGPSRPAWRVISAITSLKCSSAFAIALGEAQGPSPSELDGVRGSDF